jgi:chemotaxis protein methyltransferase CheR
MDQIRAVVNIVVPSLAQAHPGMPIRIWSVPCATGEEPLTIAMLLDEAGWFHRAPIEIHGSDASGAAISKAMAGRYRERSFRSLPADFRERYFKKDGDVWAIDPVLHGRVASWSVVNLKCEGEVALRARAQIIFCRNVFIYFSESGVREVVSQFSRLMPSPGYLCVGASESLLKLKTSFELEEIGGAFVYVQRRGERSQA